MNRAISLAVASAALAACSDSKALPDGGARDTSVPDVPGMSPPPVLGPQIDRLGRPGIATLLVAAFAAPADQAAQKDAYNRAPDPATWKTTTLRTNVTIAAELASNLAAFDAIDTSPAIPVGCGNAVDYIKPLTAASYASTAALFADDQLYIDTAMTTCNVFLALEIEQGGMGRFSHAECGGRTLTHDATDLTYSVLASGVVDGLDQAGGFSPNIHGSLTAHTDLLTGFPFLGPPHLP